jgi:hypothetical protein
MATIFLSKGTIGSNSTDPGTAMPLSVIDKRLAKHQVVYQGDQPKQVLPTSEYYAHIVIAVTELDHPCSERFGRHGFYYVAGLHPKQAGFLFEPYTPISGPWYVRSLSSTEGARYERLADAIAQVQETVLRIHAGKHPSRTEDGKVALHESDGSLFNVIWIEDEDGHVMRF